MAILLIAGLVVGGLYLRKGSPEDKAPTRAAVVPTVAPTPVKLTFDVSSYTTTGTGFKEKDSIWATQRYTNSKFGNLKPGAGLVLDLGSAKEITSVSFNAESGPLTVELRSADEMPAGTSGGDQVGDAVSATGKTELDAAEGGKHRYWMIWVTDLGPTLKARIGSLGVSALPSAS